MLRLKQTMVSKPFPLSLGWWGLAVPFYDEPRASTEQSAKWLTIAGGGECLTRGELGTYDGIRIIRSPYLRHPFTLQMGKPMIGLADQKSTALSPRYPGTQFYG